MLIPVLKKKMEDAYRKKEYDIAVELAKVLFYADPLNTEALDIQIKSLKRLSRTFEAKNVMRAFNKEYQKDFGEKYEYKNNE
jgi:hypothetical protein